ncbi:MAG: NUDIX hydrolase [Candidatus Shapirobacteria bacterium]
MKDTRKDTKMVVVCLIKNREGKYLMIKPSNYKNFGKYQEAWYPPTGHIKEGESNVEAIVREMKEELDVEIRPVKLLSEWEQDVPGEWAYWWECEIMSGKIKMSEELSELKYFSTEELKSLKLWPAETKFFQKFFWN